MSTKHISKSLIFLAVAVLTLPACHKKLDYDYSRWYKDPYAADAGRPVSVMSFNLRAAHIDADENSWDNRRPAVKAMLKDRSPVLMGSQECDYLQREHILADDPRYGAIGVGFGGPAEESEEDIIFYIKDSVEVLSSGTFYLTSTPDIPSKMGQTNHYRVCTWARIKLKADGRQLYHFNTHLDTNESIQAPEMDVVFSKIQSINTDNLPIFLTADWNCEENSTIFSGIRGDGFKSARQEAAVGDSYRTFNGFGKYGNGQTLDHCWFKGFNGVNRFTTLRDKYAGVTYISDHYPIEIVLKF